MTVTSFDINRVAPGTDEKDLWIRPSRNFQEGTKRGCIYGHFGGATALTPLDYVNNPGTYKALHSIADECEYPVGVSDLGSLRPAGNELSQTRTGQCIDFVRDVAGANDQAPIGYAESSSAATLVNYWSANPDAFSAMILVEPVWALDYLYQTNPGGIRANIQAAYGIVWPTPLPAGFDSSENMAPLAGKPFLLFGASDDVVFTLAMKDQFLALVGDSAEYHSVGALGHGAAAIAAVDVPGIMLPWIKEHDLAA